MTDDPIVATGLITSIWNNILIDISISVEELNESDAEIIEDYEDIITTALIFMQPLDWSDYSASNNGSISSHRILEFCKICVVHIQ